MTLPGQSDSVFTGARSNILAALSRVSGEYNRRVHDQEPQPDGILQAEDHLRKALRILGQLGL